MNTFKNNSGFTLVEALVTGVIVAVVGIAFFTVFIMYSQEQRESLAMSRMQMQYEALRQQIADDTRKAAWVHTTNSRPAPLPLTPASGILAIWMIARDNTTIHTYTIGNGTIQINNAAFITGYGPVQIAGGSFSLTRYRDRVILNGLQLRTTVDGKTYQLGPRSEEFLCRNWEL